MKKNIAFIVILIMIFTAITAVIINFKNPMKNNKGDKIEVIATLFPQYDFAKQIGGDKVNVTLLLPPGTESHTYEPTPQDMIKINESDLFVFTGAEMEPWAENLISGMKKDINVLDLSKTVKLINTEEFEEEHEQHHDGDEEEHEHHHEEEHNHAYDPHIWLNPQYAIKMVRSIEDELINIDPQNATYYKNNADNYIKQIEELDLQFDELVNNSNSKKIAFGGAFAYAYFVERYDLDFMSAYDTCGESAEPSTAKLKEVIEYINENNIPVVFYKEYSNGNIAKTISDATGAKMLVFNTVHNVSRDELNNGASYISIMKENLENLKQAL
jgi:zinc transport system substrate-binding protein